MSSPKASALPVYLHEAIRCSILDAFETLHSRLKNNIMKSVLIGGLVKIRETHSKVIQRCKVGEYRSVILAYTVPPTWQYQYFVPPPPCLCILLYNLIFEMTAAPFP